MLFIEWWIVRRLACGILLALASIWLFWAVRKRRSAIRLPLQLLNVPAAMLSALFLCLTLMATLPAQSYGNPIYSPDRTLAVRAENSDEGAMGGVTVVTLYRWHGFNTSRVYDGSFLSVEDKDLRWISNSELRIDYRIDYKDIFERCRNAGGVSVHCIAKPDPAQGYEGHKGAQP